MARTKPMDLAGSFIADCLRNYWEKGVEFGHGYESGKIDPKAFMAEAQEIADRVAKWQDEEPHGSH